MASPERHSRRKHCLSGVVWFWDGSLLDRIPIRSGRVAPETYGQSGKSLRTQLVTEEDRGRIM